MTGLSPAQKASKQAARKRLQWRAAMARRANMTPAEIEAEESAIREEIARRVALGLVTVGPPVGWKEAA